MRMFYKTKWHLFSSIKKLLESRGYLLDGTDFEEGLKHFSEVCFNADMKKTYNTSLSSQFYFTLRELTENPVTIQLGQAFDEAVEICNERETPASRTNVEMLLFGQVFSLENTDECTIEELAKLENVSGIYYLYDRYKKLIYIGKSVDLSSRIIGSYKERGAHYFRYSIVNNVNDIHILEPYLICQYKPPLNKEFVEDGYPSFKLTEPEISKDLHHIAYMSEVGETQ